MSKEIFPLSFKLNEERNELTIFGVDKPNGDIIQHTLSVPVIGYMMTISQMKLERRSYDGVNYDIIPGVSISDGYFPIKILADKLSELDWFLFNIPGSELYNDHAPLAKILIHLNVKPFEWIKTYENGISNISRLDTPYPRILSENEVKERKMKASFWHCPLDLVNTQDCIYHFLAWKWPYVFKRDSLSMTPSDSDLCREFSLECPVEHKQEHSLGVYKLLSNGYYPHLPQGLDSIPVAIKPLDKTITIKKKELFITPSHLQHFVDKIRLENLKYEDKIVPI